MYVQLFPVRFVGLAAKIGHVQLHGTLTAFAGPVNVRVAVKPLLEQEPRVLLTREMATDADWPAWQCATCRIEIDKETSIREPAT